MSDRWHSGARQSTELCSGGGAASWHTLAPAITLSLQVVQLEYSSVYVSRFSLQLNYEPSMSKACTKVVHASTMLVHG